MFCVNKEAKLSSGKKKKKEEVNIRKEQVFQRGWSQLRERWEPGEEAVSYRQESRSC